MPIVQGENANASDFISKSERNATPANDAGKGVKLESDGRLSQEHMEAPNAVDVTIGEAFTGASTPQPAYISKSDGKAYLCDGNDTGKMKFVGFVTSSGSANDTERLVLRGLVRGFSGLTVGEKYYLSDTAGAISTTPGTYAVMVGIAISATTLLIQKGRRFARGTIERSDGNAGTSPVTCTVGFRAQRIIVYASTGNDGSNFTYGKSWGGWNESDGNLCLGAEFSGTGAQNLYAYAYQVGESSAYWRGIVQNVTDTSFEITVTENAFASGVSLHVWWEAEGEI